MKLAKGVPNAANRIGIQISPLSNCLQCVVNDQQNGQRNDETDERVLHSSTPFSIVLLTAPMGSKGLAPILVLVVHLPQRQGTVVVQKNIGIFLLLAVAGFCFLFFHKTSRFRQYSPQ